jgi:hypothetical protein
MRAPDQASPAEGFSISDHVHPDGLFIQHHAIRADHAPELAQHFL